MQAATLARTGRADRSGMRAHSGTARRARAGSTPAYMAGHVTDPATRRHEDACPACASKGASCPSCGAKAGTVAGGGADPWAIPARPNHPAPAGGGGGGAPFGGGVWPLHVVFDHFPFDRATLTAANYDKLEMFSRMLRALPRGAVDLVAIGHTDTTGAETYNVGLSQRRAATVADAIGLRVGTAVTRLGHGEREPVASERTEEGRARNRRVDVQIRPGSLHWTLPIGDPEPKKKPQPTPQDDTHTFFCLQNPAYFALCVAMAAGAAALLFEGLSVLAAALAGLLGWLGGVGSLLHKVKRVLDCLLHPKQCLLGPGDDTPEPEKDKPPPPPHACEASRSLPHNLGPVTMRYDPSLPWFEYFVPFEMEVSFRDDPPTGCACHCGEYRQEVKGSFEHDLGSGWRSLPPDEIPRMADGSRLHPTVWKEDAHQSGAYGRRLARQRDDDGFHADQATGCHYHGEDKPGFRSTPFTDPLAPGRYRFHLSFRGAPVDACISRTHLLQPWSHWEAIGPEITYPPPSGGGTVTTPQGPGGSGPIGPPGSGLSGPLTAGTAVEMEKRWKSDPTSLCLDEQISCGAGTLADTLQRQGKPLTGAARSEAIAREAHALYAHCDNLHVAAMHATGDSVEALAGRRLDNFLRWGEAAAAHKRAEACP